MTTYKIENTSGQFWTGTCWGCVAEEYTAENLPESLPDVGDLWINSLDADWLDAGYSIDDSEIDARVRI